LIGRRERDPVVQVDEVALVDPRRRRVDDDEHLGGEVLAAAVEDDAGNVDRARLFRPLVQVETQRGEPVLPVDNQEPAGRLAEATLSALAAARAEVQPLGGEEQDRSGNGRLRNGGLVEVLELTDLSLGDGALERLVVALDLGDELGDVVVLRDLARGDLLAVAVEAADEADLRQQLLGRIADEVEDAVLLPDLRRLHEPLPPKPSRVGPGA
jgi:hypothetical protein